MTSFRFPEKILYLRARVVK